MEPKQERIDYAKILRSVFSQETPFFRAGLALAMDILFLMQKKNADYGETNIFPPPDEELTYDERKQVALMGIATRSNDKTARLRNLICSGKTPSFESIEDTLKDQVAYGILGLLALNDFWREKGK